MEPSSRAHLLVIATWVLLENNVPSFTSTSRFIEEVKDRDPSSIK